MPSLGSGDPASEYSGRFPAASRLTFFASPAHAVKRPVRIRQCSEAQPRGRESRQAIPGRLSLDEGHKRLTPRKRFPAANRLARGSGSDAGSMRSPSRFIRRPKIARRSPPMRGIARRAGPISPVAHRLCGEANGGILKRHIAGDAGKALVPARTRRGGPRMRVGMLCERHLASRFASSK